MTAIKFQKTLTGNGMENQLSKPTFWQPRVMSLVPRIEFVLSVVPNKVPIKKSVQIVLGCTPSIDDMRYIFGDESARGVRISRAGWQVVVVVSYLVRQLVEEWGAG